MNNDSTSKESGLKIDFALEQPKGNQCYPPTAPS